MLTLMLRRWVSVVLWFVFVCMGSIPCMCRGFFLANLFAKMYICVLTLLRWVWVVVVVCMIICVYFV